MTPYQKRLTAVTRRMAEDMRIRNLAQATIDAYTYHVGRFGEFLGGGRELASAGPEDVRSFQLHLLEVRKVGWSSFNQAVCGLRFLYSVTYPKPWPVAMIPFGKRPRRLPTVLSHEEVEALLACTKNLKHRVFLTTLYAAGLRLSEATHLKTGHPGPPISNEGSAAPMPEMAGPVRLGPVRLLYALRLCGKMVIAKDPHRQTR